MIRTSITPEETAFLQAVAYDRRVYEAGALLGHSTCALAQVAKRVTSVDPHQGYPSERPRPTWDLYRHNIVGLRVDPMRAEFQQVPVDSTIDFAFCDLTGKRAITECFLEHTAHVPVVAVHDYGKGGCGGATEAVDRWIRARGLRATRVGHLIVLEAK